MSIVEAVKLPNSSLMYETKNIYRIFMLVDFIYDNEGVDYQLSYTRTILFNDGF